VERLAFGLEAIGRRAEARGSHRVGNVEDDDDVASLHERIKVAEREMLVTCVGRMAREGFTITDRKVRFGK